MSPKTRKYLENTIYRMMHVRAIELDMSDDKEATAKEIDNFIAEESKRCIDKFNRMSTEELLIDALMSMNESAKELKEKLQNK